MKNKQLLINQKSLILSIFALSLIFIAGFRTIGIDNDSLSYISILGVDISEANFIDKEPFFWLINELNKFLFNGYNQTFFLIFAIIGVSIKLYIIRKYSLHPILSVLTYISIFYILQEMTQIRAGVAIGIVFWAMHDLISKNNTGFLLKIIMATLFHYSAIVMIFIYFLSYTSIYRKFYIFLPLLGIFLSQISFIPELLVHLVSILPDFLSIKIQIYLSLMEQDKLKEVNPFNIGNFFLLCIYYLNLYIFTREQRGEKYYILCIKLLGFGFFILFTFSFLEVFAYRISNYLFFSLVFLIPITGEYFRQKKLLLLLIGLFLIYTLTKNIIYMLNI